MLKVENLSVRYGHREAVHDVSLSVEEGEIVTLVGSNGAGKTTTLKAISGLLRATGGTITFEGTRIDRLSPHQVIERGLVQVPEGRLLFPEMTVLEHLELGALRGRPGGLGFAERLRWVYDLFPVLEERRTQKAGTMSGGQQQMVAIARGLMANPKCLMLDEPSLGLAPIMVDTLADTIKSLHAGGITILLVEQRVDLALRLADRAYVLETGRVVMQEAAHTLLADPRIKTAYLGL
ncbi:ABC transporter ATP-binding protein [Azospirillum sp.]|uniref:ABC transporter ATP-binding protein n=1 Tax=Azospirillum sp. TaxID=34012 RepID=UPI002D61190F|nr:ABC transporter ATP-binding protein [Azospirillum sp.]HYD67977.1 ABC transporter ATP-binding protein [Azospirillum sp.]